VRVARVRLGAMRTRNASAARRRRRALARAAAVAARLGARAPHDST
jgi:hypothetical protein